MKEYMEHLTGYGLRPWKVEDICLPWFKFGDSQQSQAQSCYDIPVMFRMKVFGILRVFVIKGGAPLLISNKVLRALQLRCDFSNDTIFYKDH